MREMIMTVFCDLLCDDSTFLIFRSPRVQSKLEPDRVEYHGVYSPIKMRDWLLANVYVAGASSHYCNCNSNNNDIYTIQPVATTSQVL